MIGLLKQWAELEPARCRIGAVWFEMETADSRFWTMVQLAGLKTSTANDIRIQDAVQRAIVARGWDYRLEKYAMEGKGQYAAWVYPLRPGSGQAGGQALGQETEAAALLGAYVKALQEQGR